MKKYLLGFSLLATANLGMAQAPDHSWTHFLNSSDMGMIKSIDTLPSGDYALAGYKQIGSVGDNNQDILVAVVSKHGQKVWSKTFGGPNYDIAEGIKVDADGNLIVVASIQSDECVPFDVSKGYYDIGVMKLDAEEGDVLWAKRYGGNMPDRGQSIYPTSDGGYLVAGSSLSKSDDVSANNGGTDAWVFKIDSDGTLDWEKNFGSANHDYAYKIQETSDGGYVFFGESHTNAKMPNPSQSSIDMWVVKVNASGTEEWNTKVGGSAVDNLTDGQATSDGGYILTGYTKSSDGDFATNSGEEDGWVVKLNSSGTISWKKSIASLSVDLCHAVKETSDNGFVVFSTQKNKVYLFAGLGLTKLNSSGTQVWEKTLLGGGTPYAYLANDGILTADGGYLAVGGASSSQVNALYGNYTTAMVKFGGTDNPTTSLWASKVAATSVNVFPNPAVAEISIELEEASEIQILNTVGATVAVHQATKGLNTFNVNALLPGIYQVVVGSERSTGLVITK
jgi:hypothetical protein